MIKRAKRFGPVKVGKVRPELVAPAGSLEKLKYALEYGADAVYCGIPDFSLRVRINQFSKEDILEGIKYAHSKGKKVFVTTNIFAHNEHIDKLEKFLTWLYDSQVRSDAFIAADPGVINVIKKKFPEANIHLSTQANCTNWQAAKFWYDLGVKRVVLGREVTLEEIKEIKKKVPKLEIEVFVHGAMCMSYSGRCMLSAWMTGRSANLGDCAQTCRWKYGVVEETRPGEFIPIEEDERGTYIFNSKDMCLIDYVKDLADIGVDSFKIEGRAKSVHYLSTVVKAYKSVIDSDYDKKSIREAKKEIAKNVSRQYTTGFLLTDVARPSSKIEEEMQNFYNRTVESGWEFVGEVVVGSGVTILTGKEIQGFIVKPHNLLLSSDEVEILQPHGKKTKIKILKLIDLRNGQEVEKANGGTGRLYLVPTKLQIEAMSVLRKGK